MNIASVGSNSGWNFSVSRASSSDNRTAGSAQQADPSADTSGRAAENSKPQKEEVAGTPAELEKKLEKEGKTNDRLSQDPEVKMAKQMGILECQTCASRQYQDQSTDVGVSFKNGGNVSPQASFAAVSGHEQEHVNNARSEAAGENKEVVSQSVRIFTDICPECGKVYVSGGETRTQTATKSAQSNSGGQAAVSAEKSQVAYITAKQYTPKTGNYLDKAA